MAIALQSYEIVMSSAFVQGSDNRDKEDIEISGVPPGSRGSDIAYPQDVDAYADRLLLDPELLRHGSDSNLLHL